MYGIQRDSLLRYKEMTMNSVQKFQKGGFA
jgi:hypothetical protein